MTNLLLNDRRKGILKARVAAEKAFAIEARKGNKDAWAIVQNALSEITIGKVQKALTPKLTAQADKALLDAYMKGATNASRIVVSGENTWAKTIGANADLFSSDELMEQYQKLFAPIGGFKGCTDTMTADIQAKVAQYFADPKATIQDLSNALQSTFAPWRADAIAITETTRMKSAQQDLYAQALGDDAWTWQTEGDDLVCSECGPMDGQTYGADDDKPPIHVNCRCEAVVSTSYTALGQAFMDQWGVEINVGEGKGLADAGAA